MLQAHDWPSLMRQSLLCLLLCDEYYNTWKQNLKRLRLPLQVIWRNQLTELKARANQLLSNPSVVDIHINAGENLQLKQWPQSLGKLLHFAKRNILMRQFLLWLLLWCLYHSRLNSGYLVTWTDWFENEAEWLLSLATSLCLLFVDLQSAVGENLKECLFFYT